MGEKQLNNVLDAKTGVKDTMPTVLGYVGIGTAFGIIGNFPNFLFYGSSTHAFMRRF